MKFGVRQIANVVFRATQDMMLGNQSIVKGQPVFYLDTAKTSTIEGAATTVYAQGGRGNSRLIAWEGEKTLTFTVEDALLSPVSFAMLSGAGLVKGNSDEFVHFHQTSNLVASSKDGSIDLVNALEPGETVDIDAPLFILMADEDGDLTGEMISGYYTLDKTRTKLVLEEKYLEAGQQLAYFPTVEQPTSTTDLNFNDWAEIAGTATDLTNETRDWRYAEPLTSAQIIRDKSPNKTEWKADHYGRNSTNVSEKPIISNQNQSISYQYMLQTQGILKGKIDALYTLAENVSIIPYNLSHLTITIGQLDGSAETTELYELPQVTIVLDQSTKKPVLSTEANTYLDSAATIRHYINNDPEDGSIATLVKYLVGGRNALGEDEDERAAGVASIEAFLTIQAALQYYTYSYIQEYSELSTVSTHNHLFATLTSNFPFLGFTANAVFTQKDNETNTIAKAFVYDSQTKTYSKIENDAGAKVAYYQGRGLAEYSGLKGSYVNSNALRKTAGKAVMVDYYVMKTADTVSELQIDAANFAGYYYVEADTLFRRQIDGVDLPANITFPNVKIQSNFTFSMAPTGDPSTFTFTMDAMPGYTYFDKTKKVLCAIQIVDDKETKKKAGTSIFGHPANIGKIDISVNDSLPGRYAE